MRKTARLVRNTARLLLYDFTLNVEWETHYPTTCQTLSWPISYDAAVNYSCCIYFVVAADWAPLGAARFITLSKAGFFEDCRFFRVLQGFVAQFGINGDPTVQAKYRGANMKVKQQQFAVESYIS